MDEGSDHADRAASVAKAMIGTASLLAVQEGVQMHGGIGMTDEYDVGFYLKRARPLEQAWGSSSYLRDRFARLGGY